MPAGPLVVPVELDALVVNQSVIGRDSFRWWQFNYIALSHYKSPEPVALDRSVGGQKPGVYLHWTLPAALRHGSQDVVSGDITYPLVPNRWLLVRVNGAQQRLATAWVIESDCPFTSKVTTVDSSQTSMYLADPGLIQMWKNSGDPFRNSVTLSPTSNKVQVATIGIRFPQTTWNERAATDMFLTAVAPSNPLFSIYVPHNLGVFSFYDDLSGIDNDTLSYYVLGWYSDPSRDIMASWQQDKTSKTPYTDLLSRLDWNLTGPAGDPAVSSICEGSAFSISWSRTGSAPAPDPLDAIRHSKTLNAAIGNTTIDAFTALIEQQLQDPAKAQLLRAFQYDFLSQLNQPNGDALLEEKIRQEWFGSKPGGYSWTIVENKSDGTSATNLTAAEQAWLSQLNSDQAALDAALNALFSLQWQLHSLWLKSGFLSDAANTFPNPPNGIPANGLKQFQSQLTAQLDPAQSGSVAAQLVAQFATVQGLLVKLPQPLWANTTNAQDAFQKGIQAFASGKQLDPAKSLKAVATPRYWQANNPVVILSGVEPPAAADTGDELNVRLAGNRVTGFKVNGKLLDASAVGSAMLSLSNTAALPQAIPALLQELFFLDPANANAIATATGQNASAVSAAMLAHDPSVYQGVLPAFTLSSWQQPWEPMFLEWVANYTYIPFSSAGTTWWTFDGTDYHYSPGAGSPSVENRGIGGISLLSPHAQFVFGSRLDDFVKKYGTNTELAQLDAWVKQTFDWQFLAQELTGFNTLLCLQDSRAFRRPAPGDMIGSLPAAALTGYGDGTIPPSLALPSPYQGQVNTVPLFPNGPAIPFHGVRQGQIYFTDLYLYDKFGRELFVIQSGSSSGLFDFRNFLLQIESALVPDRKINTAVAAVAQLPPRVLQPARLDLRLLDSQSDNKVYGVDSNVIPISGWVLPNHLDDSILIYGPDGTALGEVAVVVAADGTKSAEWKPPPHSTMTQADVAAAAPHLAQMIASPALKQEASFNTFLSAIDETLWTTDPLGNRVDQNLSVLVGRPLALLRVRLQFQLDGTPINDTGWAATFNPSTPDFLGIPFLVRLGDQATREDGVIGYFTGTNYDVFNSVASPQTAAAQTYVKPIGPLGVPTGGNYLPLSFAQPAFITILADPRASIHATTGILPVKQLDIPQQFVDQPLSSMEIAFRMGPILSLIGATPNQGGTEPLFPQAITYPLPAEQNGSWSWWELMAAANSWTGYDVVKSSPNALIGPTPNSLREGYFQFITALNKRS